MSQKHLEGCQNPGKTPLVKNWHQYATEVPSEARIKQWWQAWPNANVGGPTGPFWGFALDVDPRHDGDLYVGGPEFPIPDTVTNLTGGGGTHYLFALPEGLKIGNRVGLFPGVDVRGLGGQIVLPPSLHVSGRRYEWEAGYEPGEHPLVPAPVWLLTALQEDKNNGKPKGPTDYATLLTGVPEGQRNDTAARLAGRYLRKGMNEAEVVNLLRLWNTQNIPPLDDRELVTVVQSIANRHRNRNAAHYQVDDTTYTGFQETRSATNGHRQVANRDYGISAADWPPMSSLPAGTPPVSTLSAEMVPEPLRPWLADVARRACIPLEMVACPAIVGLGAVVGRSIGIHPSRYDDFLVVPNLWGGIVARPGAMKSHAIDEALKPLQRLAATAHDRYQTEVALQTVYRETIQVEIEGLRKDLKVALKKHGDVESLQQGLAEKLAELEAAQAIERRYMTQDATVEKLGELLRDNSRGLLVLRDELAGWLRNMDKLGREGDREFYLEAWNGTGGYTFDRIARGTVHIEAIALSIYGGIQPGKLLGYIQEAIEGGRGADGLLQRLQLLVWPDGLGEWELPNRWPDNEAKNRAYEIFRFLDHLEPTTLGAEEKNDSIPALRFTPEAQQVFDAWRTGLENRLRSDQLANTPAFESHMAKYRSLMPSLALLFHLVDVAAKTLGYKGVKSDESSSGTFGTGVVGRFDQESSSARSPGVSEPATRLAVAWCDFLQQHARKVYASELYPGVEGAQTLATRIKQGDITDGQSVRDIYRHHWTGLGTSSQVAAAVDLLTDVGWVRVESVDTGGRPTEVLKLHPHLRDAHHG
jgi:putative DNA primase/helicase